MTYGSFMGISLIYPIMISVFEVFMLIYSFSNPGLFGEYLGRYRGFYISFFIASVVFLAVSLFIKKDLEKRYRFLSIINPVFAGFSYVWALAVTYSDASITGSVDTVLFLTFALTVPLSVFMLAWQYVLIVSVSDILMVLIIVTYTAVSPSMINLIIFFIFQFILGLSLIQIKLKLSEKNIESKERIEAELTLAARIQHSILPREFPAFPDRKEFELFASMHAAKVVGGDFYDFYMVKKDTLGLLIADVSGKSIPGAMFMMRGKSVIRNLTESGLPPADVFYAANNKLNEGNDELLFITAWMGYIDLDTGIMHVVNAGHNPPVLIRDGKAEYVDVGHGMMLAAMSGMKYEEHEIKLNEGDLLFMYTDGVTEAINADEEQYGEDRLLKLLSFGDEYPDITGSNGMAETVCEMVKADLDHFVNGAEQFDDITMVCVRYLGWQEPSF